MQATLTEPTALWTIADIAAFYKRSVRQARRIVHAPGFPAPARGDRNRWAATAVVAYASGVEVVADDRPELLGPTGQSGRIVRRRKELVAA